MHARDHDSTATERVCILNVNAYLTSVSVRTSRVRVFERVLYGLNVRSPCVVRATTLFRRTEVITIVRKRN